MMMMMMIRSVDPSQPQRTMYQGWRQTSIYLLCPTVTTIKVDNNTCKKEKRKEKKKKNDDDNDKKEQCRREDRLLEPKDSLIPRALQRLRSISKTLAFSFTQPQIKKKENIITLSLSSRPASNLPNNPLKRFLNKSVQHGTERSKRPKPKIKDRERKRGKAITLTIWTKSSYQLHAFSSLPQWKHRYWLLARGSSHMLRGVACGKLFQ